MQVKGKKYINIFKIPKFIFAGLKNSKFALLVLYFLVLKTESC